ncbi:hypothetical protein H4R26_000214 [Coemansia thaxteri]|uniref:ENTH domain-containing protein n=1 Tax=Coemansia thaxteri TaxID=2663907 RepID=A0A9W8EI46_9FUNG|nr:hypothetical protein H4R26_000214 [Coemansia thaxteri]KAJ2486446.1 hypothetical protein EV174_001111 [Coemansia sp. RSA 2320]
MSARGVMRTVKNYTKGYSPMQMKVREATSNDPGMPPGSLMGEIAQATYNQSDFLGVMEIIDKRLNDKGKHWRHVFKALVVLDFCLHVGSKFVVEYAIDNIFIVKTLREFQHIDDSGRDQGTNVRQKAKELTRLLLDRPRLEKERSNRNWMNNRMGFGSSSMEYYNNNYASSSSRLPPSGNGASGSRTRPGEGPGHGRRNSFSHPNQSYGDDDNEMRKAIAESKREAATKRVPTNYDEDAELKKAIEESAREARREDEDKKKKEQPSTASEADLLGGLDDSFSMAGGNSSMNNFNNSTMMSTTSFSQQQYGSTSGANDMFGAFGNGSGAQMMGAGDQFGGVGAGNNTGFDPFGLSGVGGDSSANAAGGMGMHNQMGFGTPLGITGNNPYDNSSGNMFGGNNSSTMTNNVITRTTITTTGMEIGGTPNPFGQTNTMMSTPGTGMFDAGMGMQGNGGMFDTNMGGQGNSGVFNANVGNQGNSGTFNATMGSQGNSGTFNATMGNQGNSGMFDSSLGNQGSGGMFDSSLGNGSTSLLGGVSGAGANAGSSGAGGFNGASGAFGSAFDGGMTKALPFGVNPNDPNARIAEIARNSDRIDPFASLAMGSSGIGGSGGQNNPFGEISSAGFGSTPSQAMLGSSSSFLGVPASTPGNLTAIGSSLVDLSPAALASSNSNSFQSFGQVNRNPFAASGSSAMSAVSNSKQPSLNQLMSGGSGSSINAFGQQQQSQQQIQQQTPTMMGGFGSVQQPQTQQSMFPQQPQIQQSMFPQQQQQPQQQQLNPFAQNTTTMNSQNNFFGL